MGHLNSPNISFYFHFLIVIKDSNIHKNKVFRFCRVHIKGYFFIKFFFFLYNELFLGSFTQVARQKTTNFLSSKILTMVLQVINFYIQNILGKLKISSNTSGKLLTTTLYTFRFFN